MKNNEIEDAAKCMKIKIIGEKDAQYLGNAASVLGGWVAVELMQTATRTASLIQDIGWGMEMRSQAARGETPRGNRHDGPYYVSALPDSWTEGRDLPIEQVEQIVASLRGEIERDTHRTWGRSTQAHDVQIETQWLAAITG
jgi:hypothetical protein